MRRITFLLFTVATLAGLAGYTATGSLPSVQEVAPIFVKYASTGGWEFGHFNSDGKTVDDAFMKACFPCHQKMKERDLVFTRYAP